MVLQSQEGHPGKQGERGAMTRAQMLDVLLQSALQQPPKMAGTPSQGAGRQNGNPQDTSGASHCIPALLKTLPLKAASAWWFNC